MRTFTTFEPPKNLEEALVFLRKIQEAAAETFATITSNPLLDFVYRDNVELLAGVGVVNHVPHGLGRPWRGYIVCRRNCGAIVYEATAQTIPARFVSLETTANVVVALYMF